MTNHRITYKSRLQLPSIAGDWGKADKEDSDYFRKLSLDTLGSRRAVWPDLNQS